MIKTLKDIIDQKKRIEDSSNLTGVAVGPLKDVSPNTTLKEIHKLMDESWKHTYKTGERMDHPPEYLQWIFGNTGLLSEFSLAAALNGKLVGIFLNTPRTILYQGKRISTGIQTALSIHPSMKGRGLAKLLHLKAQELACGSQDGTFYWYDTTTKEPYTSHSIFQRLEGEFFNSWGEYPLKAHVFNLDRARANTHLRFYEGPTIQAVNAVKRLFSNPKSSGQVVQINNTNLEEAVNFVNNQASANSSGRIFEVEEFGRYALFSQGRFETLGTAHVQNGQVKGVSVVYPIQIIGANQDSIVFVDSIFLSQDLDTASRRFFLESSADIAKNKFNPFGIVGIDPKLSLSLGYIPTKERLSCYHVAYSPNLNKSDRIKALVIDHK